MMKLPLRAIAAACVLAACSPARTPAPDAPPADEGMPSGPRAVDRATPDQDFTLTVSENQMAQRFELTLSSRSERPLCLGMTDWPDEHGQIVLAGDNVSYTVNGVTYPMRNSTAQDRGSAGVRRVEPRGSLTGFIGFDQFPAAAFAADGGGELSLELRPAFCDSGETP
jgi:hypothetical protein